MIHIVVFGYVFVVLVGIVCLTIATFLYLKFRNKLLFNFLIYFSAFTLFVFSYLVVLTYINVNLADESFIILILVIAIILFSYSFLMFSILHFVHILVLKNSSAKRNFVEILIGFIALLILGSSFKINWGEEQIYQTQNFSVLFSIVLLFLVIGYSFIMKLIHIKKIEDERKRILIKTSIMNIIFIPGFILDYYLLKSGYYSVFIPIFYLCSSILFLLYFVKKHNADLITVQMFNDSQECIDYLAQAGISKREKEIVDLILKGYTNRKIANQLFISLSTVKTHIKNIFQKLKVESRFEIIATLSKSKRD